MARREKKQKSGVGKLFLGIFLGFILSLGAIVGVGFFAYKNLSIAWLNKNFNTKFDLGTNEANSKTVESFFKSVSNVLQMNTKTYTFNQLKDDFGIDVLKMLSDSIRIDMSSMGECAITNIADGMKDVISNLNAEEIGQFVDVSALNDVILNKEITYYVNDNKLFRAREYSDKVSTDDLNYKIAEDKVYLDDDTENGVLIGKDSSVNLNGNTYYVYNGEVYGTMNYVNPVDKESDSINYEINATNILIEGTLNANSVDLESKTVLVQIKNMNLVPAVKEYFNKIGDITTIGEIEKELNLKLPEFISKYIDRDKAINQLGDEIDKIKLGYFLKGYTIDETDPLNIIVKNDKGEIVTGILYDMAIERVGNVSDLTKKFDQVAAVDIKSVVNFSSDTNKFLEKEIKYHFDLDGKKLYKDVNKTKEVEFKYTVNESATKVMIGDYEFDVEGSIVKVQLNYVPLTSAVSDYMFIMENEKTFGELAEEFKFSIPSKLEDLANKKLKEINDDVFNDIELGGFLGYLKDETDVNNPFYYKDKNDNSIYDDDVDELAQGLMKTLTNTTMKGIEDISGIIGNATANDLSALMEFEDGTNAILSKTNKYYFNQNDEKLYKSFDGATYSGLVNETEEEFEYELSADKKSIIVNGEYFEIDENNEIMVELKFLPLSYALNSFTDNMGKQLTFKELSEDFGVKLPTYLQNIDQPIDNLKSVIDEMKLGEVLGYVYDGGKWYTNSNKTTEITSLQAKFAEKAVKDLKNLNSVIDELTVEEIFSNTTTGVLSLIDKSTTVQNIPDAIKSAITNNDLATLVSSGVVSTDVDLTKGFTLADKNGVKVFNNVEIGTLKFDDIFRILEVLSELPN